jgi:phosphopantetheine adenylyltransferase
VVKEVAYLKGDVRGMVSAQVADSLGEQFAVKCEL